MADKAASIIARLKNKASESGRSYQLCLQLFCQEEFLRRLSKSDYLEHIILKGGLLIYALTEFDSRVTADVDFLLKHMDNSPEHLKLVLTDIINVDTGNNYVEFEILRVIPISIAKKYTGIGATIVAKIKNTRTTFGIDFSVGDVIVPKQELRSIPTQLDDFEAPVINSYSIETIIAEKIDAILYLMEFSSRMKDYYDIYFLASRFDFEGAVLSKALLKTFDNRNHVFSTEHFEQIMSLGSDDMMTRKWNTFIRKTNTISEDFQAVLESIRSFLWEPFTSILNKEEFDKNWIAIRSSWELRAKSEADH
jgi:predicted nucleotidyltransferase component of viral defense system